MPADAIHPAAAVGFDRAADAYERARPSYPSAAVDTVVAELDLRPGRRALDLAAGTGKFTRLLIPSGVDLVAVEPVAGMREHLSASLPDLVVLDGTAESIPLPDESVDGIVCAQAFHWFDGPVALRECGRVLADGAGPGGGERTGALAVVYNVRDESVPWVAELTRLTGVREADRPHHFETRRDFPGWVEAEPRLELEGWYTFRYAQHLTVDLLVDRVASQSWIGAMEVDEREALLEQVRDLARTHPDLAGHDQFDLPYDTEVTVCRRR